MHGVNMRLHIWHPTMKTEEDGGAIMLILALSYEYDKDPEIRRHSKPIHDKQREKLIIGAVAGAIRCIFFKEHRVEY